MSQSVRRRLISLALILLAAVAVAAPATVDRRLTVGDGELRLEAFELAPEALGHHAGAGRVFVAVTGLYRRGETASPLPLTRAQDAFRLELADGRLVTQEALAAGLTDAWWGGLDIQPAEARRFELLFRIPASVAPVALLVTLPDGGVRVPLTPTAATVTGSPPTRAPTTTADTPATSEIAAGASAPPAPTPSPTIPGTAAPAAVAMPGRTAAPPAPPATAAATGAPGGPPASTASSPAATTDGVGSAAPSPTAAPSSVASVGTESSPEIPPPAEPRDVLPLPGVVAGIEAAEGHEAVVDGRIGPDVPVARVAVGTPLTVTLRRPVRADRLRVLPRIPGGSVYRLRIEVSPDGEGWETVEDVEDVRGRTPVGVALADRPVQGVRVTATARTGDSRVLELEEIELWSRDHIPRLRFDLAWAGHGGRVIGVAPPVDEPQRPLFSLIDGNPSSWWAGAPGASEVEVTLGFLEDRGFLVDAVQLVVDQTKGIPARLEIQVTTEGPDGPYRTVGVFEVPEEREPLFVFDPHPARYVRLRAMEPRGSARIWLAAVRVFEAEGEGLPSRFATLAAIPSEAPPAARNLALWANGGELVARPAALEGEPRRLQDGIFHSGAVHFELEEAPFVLAFLGGRRVRVDEVRFHPQNIGWPGRVRVEVAETPEGPFTPVADRLLPPGEGWRAVRFEPVETRYLRLVIRPDPRDGGKESLTEIAVLERPREGAPSVLEVPNAERRPLGPNLALAPLGGRVVRVTSEEQHQGWSARRLIDGLVADQWYLARGSGGFVTAKAPTWPVEIDLALAGDRPARLVGIGIDPQVRVRELGLLDTDFRAAPEDRPRRFEIETSLDGTSWTPVLRGMLRPRWVRQVFAFAEPVSARFVRFRFLDNYGGKRLALGELEAYGDPTRDTASWPLANRELNIARPELGGAVVTYTSQYAGGEAYVGNLFDGEPKSIWSPGDGWRWPQKVVLAFAGNAEAEIAALEIIPREPAYRPKVVKIRTSRDRNPTRGYTLVGRFDAPADVPSWRIDFPEPVRARFLEVSFVEGFDPRRLGVGELRVIEVRRPGYRSVLARGAEDGGGVGTDETREQPWTIAADLGEREPNDDPSQAQIVGPGTGVAGRIDPLGERDIYLLTTTDEIPRAYRFAIEGRPALKTRLEVEDKGGETVFTLDPARGRSRFEGTVTLGQASHLLRLYEPRTRIVLVVDKSGSMEARMEDARAAVERFLAGMTEQEEIALLVFSKEVELAQDFTADRTALRAAARRTLRAGGGTRLYDAMMQATELLEGYRGNRAIVLLSDGADSGSEDAEAGTVFARMRESGIRFYAIALGEGMWRYEPAIGTVPARMLDFWARASDGAMLATPSSSELERLYARIARDLRSGTRYRFRLTPEEGRGRLVVRQTGERIAGVGVPDRILFILDASGSMRGKDARGKVKMRTAKRVLTDLVRALPDDVMVGLRVYGHRYPRKPKARSCTDSQLVVPFQRVDKDAFAAFVEQIRPRGQTPIGLSLAQVADDFGDVPGRKVVVLITDGEETCSPEPGDPDHPPAVVRRLQERGVDVQVQIVGFDIRKSEVRDFLEELAASTGGRFYRADDAAGLARALDEALRARFRVVDLFGQVVAEGVLDGGAVELPAGLYRLEVASTRPLVVEEVRIEAGRETRIDINREGEEIAVDRSIGAPVTALARAEGPAPTGTVTRPEATEGTPATAQPPSPAAPSGPAPAVSPRETRIAMLLDEAEDLFRQQKLTTPEEESALARYRAVLALDPDNAEARAGIRRIVRTYAAWADRAEKRGDLAKAERYYGRALVADPQAGEVYMLRGLVRLQRDRYRQAAQDFERARRLMPDRPEADFYLGIAELKADRPEKALAPLERVWQSESDRRFDAAHLRAIALIQADRPREAFDQLMAALEAKGDCESAPLDDTCTQFWSLTVLSLRMMGRDDVVMESMPEVLELGPTSPEVYDAVAETFRDNGREEEARRIEAMRRQRFGR